jgi:hypothetical protein
LFEGPDWHWIPYAAAQVGATVEGQTVTDGAYGWVVTVNVDSKGLGELTRLLAEQTVGEPVILPIRLPGFILPAKGGSG